jgi:hypothetical protein
MRILPYLSVNLAIFHTRSSICLSSKWRLTSIPVHEAICAPTARFICYIRERMFHTLHVTYESVFVHLSQVCWSGQMNVRRHLPSSSTLAGHCSSCSRSAPLTWTSSWPPPANRWTALSAKRQANNWHALKRLLHSVQNESE